MTAATVRVIASSELDADTAREANIVYLGLISGMGLLEDTTFAGSGFAVGESYDELIDRTARQTYTSEEARSLASPVFYRDYGYSRASKRPAARSSRCWPAPATPRCAGSRRS